MYIGKKGVSFNGFPGTTFQLCATQSVGMEVFVQPQAMQMKELSATAKMEVVVLPAQQV